MTQNKNSSRTPGKWPGYWQVKQLRRGSRRWIGALLSGGRTEPDTFEPLDPTTIKRVLVCRVNKRLGNMLFLTPLIRSLAETLPAAEIDIAVRDPAHADLFRTLPNVKIIHALPPGSWLWPFRIIAYFHRLRRRHYDLAIDPQNNSVSNRVITRLSGARWSLGFWVRDQMFPITHAIPGYNTGVPHETLRPLVLLRKGFPTECLRLQELMGIGLSAAELEEGRRRLEIALGSNTSGPVLGFFAEATGKKRLPVEWWQSWLQAMRSAPDAPRLLQILPPGPVSPLAADLAHVCCPEQRKLAAVIANMDLFVSADAGPLHLGSAAGAAVVGLFVRTLPEVYGPRGPHDLSLELKDMTPESAALAVRQHLAGLRPRQS